jgi:hypothetical protein
MYALSWYRSGFWAEKLKKPAGRGKSTYLTADRAKVESVAAHINSIQPEMDCRVEVYNK